MARDADPGHFHVTCGGYTLDCTPNGLPSAYHAIKSHAALVDEIDLHDRGVCCVAVRRCGESRSFLVVAQSYHPNGAGFEPGALVVPATHTLFVGAGERLLAYQLGVPARLWEDRADTGFLGWDQHGDTILMSAELELAAWDSHARKLWTMFVEPPWSYEVNDDTIELDVMGSKQVFGVRNGPPRRP